MSSGNENDASPFSTNQAFKSREDLMNWVQNVGRKNGYVIVTKRSKTTPSGVMYKVILMCDRGGIFKSKSKKIDTSVREINSKKINCPFELAGTYSQINDFWTLQVKCDKHNHEPGIYMEGHSFAKRLTDDEARLVADLTVKNVKPRDIYSTIKKHNENNKSTIKIIYNQVSKVRMSMAAGRTPMQNLFYNLQGNGYTFEFQKNEVSHELEELFFIHPTSLKIWRAFPHVLFMDATYKTNKYNMPFLQIIGVTSTKMSFCIAYVFMLREKECNYTWALKCLRSNMDESVYPRVSLKRSRIFINPKHNTYMFQHLLGFVSKNAIELIYQELKRSNGLEITFQNCGCILRTSCGLPCACELATLYSGRYIPIESIDVFWRKLDLLSATSIQDDDLTCDAELEQLKKSFQKQSKFGKTSILRKLRGLFDATTNFVAEPAVQKNTRGRPNNKDKQQKTKCVKPSKFVPPTPTPQPQPQPHRYSYSNDYKFDLNHSPSRYSSYMVPEPSRHSSYMDSEPARYSSYMESEPSRYYSYMFSEPPMYNSYMEPEPSMIPDPLIKAISRNYQPYVRHVHNVMGDGNCGFRVVATWLGFDESYWPQIRKDLLNEIESHECGYANMFLSEHVAFLHRSINFFESGDAPFSNWMIMSDTGAVIASCYNVIVHFISEKEDTTWLPLWSSPPENPQNVTWVIGLVHGNHFVKVDLQGDYPLPNIHPQWRRFKRDCAAAWETLYLSRV